MELKKLHELLSAIESLEDPLLSWGVVDGGLSDEEFRRCIRNWSLLQAPFHQVEDLASTLREHGLIIFDDSIDPPRWRSRVAESLRLLVRLRQMFPTKGDAQSAWRKGIPLVADFRYLRRERSYPLRDLDWDATLEGLDDPTQVLEDSLRSLTRTTTGQMTLSGFQVRATRQILASLKSAQSNGIVVGAGTGSGKTLSFYLPVYAYLASLRDCSTWTRAVAVYPRNELLRDQFTSAFANARRADDLFLAQTGRKLRIGAFYGAAPQSRHTLEGEYSQWRKMSQGYVCPYLACPGRDGLGCGGELHWPFASVNMAVETLLCGSCGAEFGDDTIVITRQRMMTTAPDIVFSTTEMVNRTLPDLSMSPVLGIGAKPGRTPRLMLLDEIHTYGGATGAQTSMTLRRWRHRVKSAVTFVGLSATLVDAGNYFADMVGLEADRVSSIEPESEELTYEGAEYMIAARSDPTSGSGVLSTTIQSAMLIPRVLDAPDRRASDGAFGTKAFVFTDDLDVTNRLYYDLIDAEGQKLGKHGQVISAAKSPLAALRNPALGGGVARRLAGQSWDLPSQLGHPIDEAGRLRVGRTSSQDTGVDRETQVTIATASLEVGFDDPDVGAVIQHKAPRDPAQFVQRKGRAGRPRGMRPLTLIVLSDYGRDRVAYEAWDSLFEPVLPRRTLPIHNRAVLRMHAAQSLLEWIAVKLKGAYPQENLWQALKSPPSGRYSTKNEKFQQAVAAHLESLLVDPTLQTDLARWLQHSLGLPNSEVDEILWHPPRPVLMGAVPALIRRLRSHFSVASATEMTLNTDLVGDHPLPDYFPSTLFGELTLSEVSVLIPSQTFRSTDTTVESMGVAQMMREYAPGRASRRFATRNATDRHWIPVIADHLEEAQEVSTFSPEFEIAATPDITYRGITTTYDLVRPHRVSLAIVPEDITDSSNAKLKWCSQFIEQGNGISVKLPLSDRIGSVIPEATFFLHAGSNWVQTHRLAVESESTVQFEDGSEKHTRVRFTHQGRAAGVGATFDVDGLRLRVNLPEIDAGLVSADHGIRSAWFRHVVTTDEQLLKYGNTFQLGWLHQALETMLILEAIGGQISLADAYASVQGFLVTRLGSTLEAVFQHPGLDLGEENIDTHPSRLLQRLSSLVQIPQVASRIGEIVHELWQPSLEAQSKWIRSRLLVTVGQAAFSAARQFCPDHDPDGLYVDVEPGLTAQSLPRISEVWLSEPTVGGGGFLEALASRVQAEPRRFLRLMWAAIQPSPAEMIDRQLRTVVEHLGSSTHLATAISSYRSSETQTDRIAALDSLRLAISQFTFRGNEHMLISNFANRLLRPGTSVATDKAAREILAEWESTENSLGVEISARNFAFLVSTRSDFDSGLGVSGGVDVRQRRIDAILSVLWPTGWRVRSEALATWNPYEDLADPLPELLRQIVPTGSRVVSIETGNVVDQLRAVLVQDDQVRLQGTNSNLGRVSDVIVELTANHVENEWLYLHPRVVEVESTPSGDIFITLETTEGIR